MGRSRIRLPVALNTAFATAAFIPTIPISPMPFTPNGFTVESVSGTMMTSMVGTSAFTGMR